MYIIENKNIHLKYFLIKIYNCGIELKGWEVKSIKKYNEFQIKNSEIIIKFNEIFIKNSFIKIYNKNITSKPDRERKLLLKKDEIKEIIFELDKKKLKLVLLGVFINKNFIKLRIALCLKKKLNMKNKFLFIKKSLKGNKISYSNKKTRRFFNINLKKKKIFFRKNKKFLKIKLSVNNIKNIDKINL